MSGCGSNTPHFEPGWVIWKGRTPVVVRGAGCSIRATIRNCAGGDNHGGMPHRVRVTKGAPRCGTTGAQFDTPPSARRVQMLPPVKHSRIWTNVRAGREQAIHIHAAEADSAPLARAAWLSQLS